LAKDILSVKSTWT